MIVPAYNAQDTLARTLQSLRPLADPGPGRAEVIVVDDGSTDDTAAIARAQQTALAPLDIALLQQANGGLSAARNAALAVATGTFVLLLDADDELHQDPRPILAEAQGSGATAVTFRVDYVRDETLVRSWVPPKLTAANRLDALTARNPLTVSSIVFRRDAVRCLFDTTMHAYEDWLFWFQNPTVLEHVVHRPDVQVARIHLRAGSMSTDRPRLGRAGQRLVEKVLAEVDGLTPRQRHNLELQRQIALLQEDRWISPKALAPRSCDAVLYLRVWRWLGRRGWACLAGR